MNLKNIARAADNIRVLSAAMVEKAKSGHPGGAMGGADFVNVLYSSFLISDPDDPTWFARSGPHVADAVLGACLVRTLHFGRA